MPEALLHYIIVHKYICTYISILCLVLHMKKGPMSSILTKITLIVSVKQLFSFFKMFSSLPSIKNFSKVFKKLWNNDEGFFFCIECCSCCLNVHVDAKKKKHIQSQFSYSMVALNRQLHHLMAKLVLPQKLEWFNSLSFALLYVLSLWDMMLKLCRILKNQHNIYLSQCAIKWKKVPEMHNTFLKK